MGLRGYQQDCVDVMDAAAPGSHLIHMATGLGKTYTFSSIERRGRVLVLSHRDELVHQPAGYYDVPVGFEAGAETSHGEEVVSASVQSLARRLDRFAPDEFDTIITDEAHHAAAPIYRRIYDHFSPRVHFGVTATPKRGDRLRLDDVFDDIIFSRDLLWGIRNGWLCDVEAKRVTVSYDPRSVKRSMGDYQLKAIDRAMNNPECNSQVAEAYRRLAVGPTLVFAVSVDHARGLAEAIPGAVAVTGKTPMAERRDIVERFRRGEVPCLVNCMVFTEGADLPCTSTVIVARPTQNDSLYAQMVGRGLRTHPGKDHLTLIDCVGVTEDRRLCCAPTLIGLDPREQMVAGERLSAMEERVSAAADTPEGWLLMVRDVDVLEDGPLAEAPSSVREVAWSRIYDGSYTVCVDKGVSYTVRCPDNVGHTTAVLSRGALSSVVADGKFEDVIEEVSRGIAAAFRHSRSLWSTESALGWGSHPATSKQLGYLACLIGPEEVRRLLDSGDGLTKYEASVLIGCAKAKSM